GPLTLDLPREIAATIVDLPSLAPRTAAAIPKELARVLDDAGLARPAAFAVRTVDPASIQPVLTLSVDSELAPGAEGFDNARAKVRFDYGPVSVDLDDRYARTSALIACVVDDQLHEVTRDIKREEQWLLELRALGFGPSRNVVFGELCLPSAADWIDLCHHEIDALRGRGWQVELDPEFPFELLIGEDWYVDLETSDTEWFTLELGVEIDGERVNLLPVVVDAIRRGEIVRERIRVETKAARLPLGDGRWVSLDSRRLSKILDVLVELFDDRLDDGRLKLARADSSRLLALVGLKWHGDKGLRKLAEQLAQRSALPRVKTPRALRAQLRDYQARGLDWLGFLRAHDFGGILADDMGLGKTIQTLAHLLVEKRARRLDRPCLVVAPRSVITNWARECERFSPSLSCAIFHGPARGRLFEAELPNVVITTYALLQRDSRLREQAWHVVILDEAQAIKNPRTKLAAAARELSARQRLCLTGTPMENNLEELWSLFTFIAPGLLGSVGAFSRHYRRPIEKGGDAGRMAALSARIAPFMLRRTKEQVLTELPPKTETVVTVSFEPRQRDLYESVRMTMEKRVREALDARGLAKSHIIVLDALLKLRQVCCHPALVKNDTARRSKAGSAKTERLVELLTELVAQGRQTIIFSQFTSMLDIVGHEIDNLGVEHRRITGKTTKRQRIVDAFQAGEFPVLMISLKAGGTGINLTAADTVIHYDPWWNPAVEDQATSRAHRIGQDKPVTVYRLVCEGTVEQRVLALQDRKRELSSAITRGAEQRSIGGLKLAPEDLDLLFSPLDA
ncbi:MAG: DEAD/DEAH box helicase, partial [Nannocystaceae bacterium]|nr:DEAD/DEAH box helicase [Nannocystaceae bacterium]